MKNAILAKLAVLLLTTLTLSGCLLVPVDDGYRDGDPYGSDRGRHRGESHDGHGGRH